jgi:2-dehydropantoate 2-reductase
MRPYTIMGSGAVGSALAGYLARQGHPILLIGRESHVRAIRAQGGLRVASRTEPFLVPLEVRTTPPESLAPNSVLFLTVQSPDVAAALAPLRKFGPRTPLVTWQNGLRAEDLAATTFLEIYGGVVRFTSTLLEPGEVRLRGPGQLIVGTYPRGLSALAGEIVNDLRSAGFEAAESPDIQDDKALKLLVNLVSGPAVLLRRTEKEPILAALQVALLEEAMRVYAAAGIHARPASGLGQTADALLAHFRAGGQRPDTAGGVYNSTWQNLHHRRPRLENDFYHGEIVRLGKQFGIATPVNARALQVLESVREAGLGPEPFDRDAFRDAFKNVVDFEKAAGETERSAPSGLEI